VADARAAVASYTFDQTRPYAITGAGKRHLEEQLETLDQVVKTAMRRLRPA